MDLKIIIQRIIFICYTIFKMNTDSKIIEIGFPATDWLPPGKKAAICFSIDDVHPGKSSDAYEAGGDLGRGVFKYVEWLLRRHPYLYITLFVTPDWQEIVSFPTRRLLARIPYLRDRIYLTRILPAGTMRLDNHPDFVRYLKQLPRTEIGLHGLHHVSRGINAVMEFQNQSIEECGRMLKQAIAIFKDANLGFVLGMAPPSWNLPANLAQAMAELGFSFVISARDLITPVSSIAVTNMSGIKGVSLIHPQLIGDGRLVHIPTNFQATSSIDRAIQIIEANGLLSIKGHIVKHSFGHVMLDGIDETYCNYLDSLFSELRQHYGESLWWASMSQIAEQVQEKYAPRH